jgi:hypothetical protein
VTGLFDERLKTFLQGPIAIVAATRDSTLKPAVARGVGVRVAREELFDLFLSRTQWPLTVEHLRVPGAPVAVTCALPATYETYQIKGHVVAVTPPDENDTTFAFNCVEAAVASFRNLGVPRQLVDQWITLDGLVRVRIGADAVFLQTPGPSAGQRRSEPN